MHFMPGALCRAALIVHAPSRVTKIRFVCVGIVCCVWLGPQRGSLWVTAVPKEAVGFVVPENTWWSFMRSGLN